MYFNLGEYSIVGQYWVTKGVKVKVKGHFYLDGEACVSTVLIPKICIPGTWLQLCVITRAQCWLRYGGKKCAIKRPLKSICEEMNVEEQLVL